ncbi:hypothetical protein PGQ11_014543 [Apiospora arundinis]|uniref:Uncharacterized protein n=1 Tax=Apiospora arundinis TaxID=335852 RepID=A0ABR2HT40_9PEZI
MSTITRSSSLLRLLATFFTLFIALGFCAAVPATSSSDVVGDNELEVRGNSQSTPKDVQTVKMGDTQFFSFNKVGMKVGSTGFNSCLGVLIVSDAGAIVGHYTATHTDIKDKFDVNTKDANKKIKELSDAHKGAIKGNVKTYVYAQKGNPGTKEWLDELVKIVKANSGVQPEVKYYGDYTNKKGSGGFTVETKKAKKNNPKYSVKWA